MLHMLAEIIQGVIIELLLLQFHVDIATFPYNTANKDTSSPVSGLRLNSRLWPDILWIVRLKADKENVLETETELHMHVSS